MARVRGAHASARKSRPAVAHLGGRGEGGGGLVSDEI